jgi:tetratricopeptide (TPR) repeat protein
MAARRSDSDLHFEIAFYENVLKKSPNFIEALMCLGDLYTKQGFYEKGLRVDQRLSELRPDDPTVFYNLACSYSLMSDVAAAEQAIKRSIELGYEDFEYMQKDPDLLNLLSTEEFQAFFKQARENAKKGLPKGETV